MATTWSGRMACLCGFMYVASSPAISECFTNHPTVLFDRIFGVNGGSEKHWEAIEGTVCAGLILIGHSLSFCAWGSVLLLLSPTWRRVYHCKLIPEAVPPFFSALERNHAQLMKKLMCSDSALARKECCWLFVTTVLLGQRIP